VRSLAFFALLFSSVLFAQDRIPAGTILPVQLNQSVRSNKVAPGKIISARIMQDVALPGGERIRAGAKIVGHVVAAKPASPTEKAQLSLRFDTVVSQGRHIPVTTNLRALAGLMDVSEAQIPESGPDRGTSEYEWTTNQIGGEMAYRGGGVVEHGSDVVGRWIGNGALVNVSARRGAKCHGEVDGNDRPQAMWVFSSDACGIYDYDLVLVHAGRTYPRGQITLQSLKGNFNVRSGSGMLLRVIGQSP
jgi:hypothetical protein